MSSTLQAPAQTPNLVRPTVMAVGALGVLLASPAFWRVDATAIDRDGALASLAVGLVAIALAARHRLGSWLALSALLAAAVWLGLPLLTDPAADPARRLPFAALALLAWLAAAATLSGYRLAVPLVAGLAGMGIALSFARLLAAFAGDPGPGVEWPVARLFIAPAALLLALASWSHQQLRAHRAPLVALACLLALMGTGVSLLGGLGHLLGNRLLSVGIGSHPISPAVVLSSLPLALMLYFAVQRQRRVMAWAAALAVFGVFCIALGVLPAGATLLNHWFAQSDPMAPARAVFGGVCIVVFALAGAVLSTAAPGRWALRLVQVIGLVGLVTSLIGLSGMVSQALYGVDPILGARQLSYLGLLAVGLAGSVVFLGACARVGPRRLRVESLPALVVALSAAITISLWGGATRQSADAIFETSNVALEAMTRTLAGELESRERDLGRLAMRLARGDEPAQTPVLAAAAAGLGVRYRTLERLTWVPFDADPVSALARETGPASLRPVTQVAELTDVERRLLRAARAGATRAFSAAPAQVDLPRSLAFVQRVERPDGSEAGALLALFVIDDRALPLLIGSPVPGFGAAIALDGVGFGVLGAAAPPADGEPGAEHVRGSLRVLQGLSTRITVWPLPGTVERLRSRVPQAIVGAGVLISALLGLVTGLAGAARERARVAQYLQRAAEDSEREIAELLEGLPDAFFAYDRDWRFTHVNRAAERLVGRPREQVIGRVLWDTAVEARRDLAPAYERSMWQRTVERFEMYYEPFGIWLSIQSFPLPDGIGVVARDVTGEHRTVEALRRREADLAQALEIADLARLEMDSSEHVVWSGAATRILGCAESELPADRAAMRSMWHPQDAAALLPQTTEGLRSGRGFDLEHRIVLRDGSVRWVHTVARVIKDGPGASRVVATVQDITERRLQARAVIERDRFFEGSRDLFCIISSDGLFVQVNPALCRLLGYGREELLGKRVFDFTHPDDLDQEQALFREAARGAPPHPARPPGRALTRSGEIRWIQWSSSLSPEGDLYAVGYDVTERIASEAARERTLAELEARNEELQQFAYIASHDLQEPLRKIQAFGDRLRGRFGELLDAEGRDYLARMDNAARRMSTLIADLLEYSRVATRGAPFAAVPLDDVLDDVLGDLEESIQSAGAQVTRDRLPVLEADRTQMAQLLQNLVSNALKYRHPARTPRVEVRAERSASPPAMAGAAPEGWIRLSVIDNGIGFDPVHRERIFAPFQRLHGRAEYAGTGIGLAIVRKIVERHGGRVHAEGRPGEGASFVVELPMRRAAGGAPVA